MALLNLFIMQKRSNLEQLPKLGIITFFFLSVHLSHAASCAGQEGAQRAACFFLG